MKLLVTGPLQMRFIGRGKTSNLHGIQWVTTVSDGHYMSSSRITHLTHTKPTAKQLRRWKKEWIKVFKYI